jgi:hypothetical protein
MWDFFGDSTSNRGYYSTMADGVKGVVDIKVGKGTVSLPTTSSVAGYSYVAIMMQSAAGMPGGYRAPQVFALNGSSTDGTVAGTNGFTSAPQFYSWSGQITFTPSVSGQVAYFFTNGTTNYSTDQAFRNAYILENTATSMIVSAGQGAVIPANTNYKYVWIMLYTGTQYYTPVRLQIK